MKAAAWEGPSDSALWEALLTEEHGQLAFDIGANGGRYSRIFARNFERVVAFEPAAESYEYLLDHRPVNVAACNVAVSDHVGSVELRIAAVSIESGQLVTGEAHPWGRTLGHRDVPCVTVDAMVDEYGIPDMIKIDVESHEIPVLHGAVDAIARNATTWMIEVHEARFEPEIRALFRDYQVDKILHDGYDEAHAYRLEHFYVAARPSLIR